MLAVAGFLGWGGLLYRQYQPFVPTSFFADNYDWQAEVIAVLIEVGGEAGVRGSATITDNDGPSAVHRTFVQRLPLSRATSGAFVKAFQERVQEKLIKEGCQPTHSGGAQITDSQAFLVSYQKGPLVGAVDVCLSTTDGNQACLVVTMHEQRAWQGGLNHGVQMEKGK